MCKAHDHRFVKVLRPAIYATATITLLVLISCEDDKITDPPEDPCGNYAPEISLEVNPKEGIAPLEVRVQGSATHLKGDKCILNHSIVLNNDANSDSLVFYGNSVDTTLSLYTFTGADTVNYSVSSRAVSQNSETASEGPIDITVYDDPLLGEPAEISLNATPLEGVSPLEVRVQGSATHPKGQEFIHDYRIIAKYLSPETEEPDSLVFTENPTDTTFTLPHSATITSIAVTETGKKSSKGPIDITVYHPSGSQEARLKDKVDIEYTVRLEHVDRASARALKNGHEIWSQTITAPEFSKRFTYTENKDITKGDYTFILDWGVGADTTSVEIPLYPIEFNLSGISFDLNEGDKKEINLEGRFHDPNPEGNPVYLSNVRNLDNRTSVSLGNGNSNSFSIQATDNISHDMNYGIELEATSRDRETITTTTADGMIYRLVSLSGQLKKVRTLEGIEGTFWVYDNNWNLLGTNISDSEKNNLTDSQGHFTVKLPGKRASEASGLELIIQAGKGFPEQIATDKGEKTRLSEGYIRTRRIQLQQHGSQQGEKHGLEIIAVPYAPYDDKPEEFKQFMRELETVVGTDIRVNLSRFDFDGRVLSGVSGFEDFDGFKRIRILDHDYFTDAMWEDQEGGAFTRQQQEIQKSKILDKNDISGIIGDFTISNEQIVFGNDSTFTDYSIDSTATVYNIVPAQGVIVVVPRRNLKLPNGSGVRGLARRQGGSGNVSRGQVYMEPTVQNWESVFSHEFGHLFLGPGHPTTLGPDHSIMNVWGVDLSTTGPADKKAGDIIYGFPEKSYMIFRPNYWPPYILDSLENIIGLYKGEVEE